MEREFPDEQRIILYSLPEKVLRPFLEKQTTRYRKPLSVEAQLADTLCLAEEGGMKKGAYAFGLSKATVFKIIRRVTKVISEKFGKGRVFVFVCFHLCSIT